MECSKLNLKRPEGCNQANYPHLKALIFSCSPDVLNAGEGKLGRDIDSGYT